MKVLLDENLDHRLRNALGVHEVFTASYKGWDGLKNGKLLHAAESDGFDVLITGDQTLSYEQNLGGRGLAVIALSSVEWRIIESHVERIIVAIGKKSLVSSFVKDFLGLALLNSWDFWVYRLKTPRMMFE